MKHFKTFLIFLVGLTGSLASISTAAAAAPLRVSLVFDDGPSLAQNAQLLALLAKEKVHVNFSFVGKNVVEHPELAAATFEAGHEINNHSYTHPHLRTLDDATVLAEITKASDAIKTATGQPPAWFWAPYLEFDDRVTGLIKKAGLVHFPYSRYHFISTSDWDSSNTTAAMIYKNATTGIQDKTVILFHEWRPETSQQLPAIFAELRRQGCQFLTFTELNKAD